MNAIVELELLENSGTAGLELCGAIRAGTDSHTGLLCEGTPQTAKGSLRIRKTARINKRNKPIQNNFQQKTFSS